MELIKIPKGNVTIKRKSYGYIESDTIFNVPEFEIGKYPVTNMEYRRFIEDNGYNKEQYWTNEGWLVKKELDFSEPIFWSNNNISQDNQPVIGVSWFEAIAYCNWISEKTGNTITLPTEQQWQRAAQAFPNGDDSGYLYPWGNEWDANKCNNSVEKESNMTTPVDYYEKAGNVSPCGVVGMVGSAKEWCLTELWNGKQDQNGYGIRSYRGGSSESAQPKDLIVTNRYANYPDTRQKYYGFRVVRLKLS